MASEGVSEGIWAGATVEEEVAMAGEEGEGEVSGANQLGG